MSQASTHTDPGSLDTATYRQKVLGCWRGKAVGGTLGQSFEGLAGPIDADFYNPVPSGIEANDDFDIQVAYARVLQSQTRPRLDRLVIAEVWRKHLRFPWNEYAVGKRNLAEGILPPFSGSYDNWFSCGCGAIIRTELWACLAPGDPERAAAYAYEDACFDHHGDGIWAAVMMATMQSYAFVESDPDTLLDRACSMLPVDSGIRQVVEDTRAWVADGALWQQVMQLIVERYGRSDFTDTRMNTGFIVLGWLASGGDFERAILITNGCGQDTDSTTASLAALLGIIDPDSIPARWLTPLGEELGLHDAVVDIEPPADMHAFADLVVQLRDRFADVWPEPSDVTFDAEDHAIPVTIGWSSPYGVPWGARDFTGLSVEHSPPPDQPRNAAASTVPGTWVTWPRVDFDDLILVIDYSLWLDHEVEGLLMFNCSEHSRVWLDGRYLLGTQPSPMFPSQHRPPVGENAAVHLSPGQHTLRASILKPPAARSRAEWVVALVESPSMEWVANAFRPLA
jgi:ADP-ribosylglycohydrolase